MKKIFTNKIVTFALIFLGVFILYCCQEEIISPKKDGSDIDLRIKGQKLMVCKGDTTYSNAAYAKFSLVSKRNNKLDTIIQGVLDANGEWDTTNFKLEMIGLPDVQVLGLLDLKEAVDSIFYLCCDNAFNLDFVYDCNEIEEVEVTCDNLKDTTITLDITNQLGGKILLGSNEKDQSGNKLEYKTSGSNITVNVSEAIDLNNEFRAQISPEPDANGNIQLDDGKQPLAINFFVKTDVVGKFERSIVLDAICNDDPNNPKSGSITVILKAEVTDNDCACPFSSNSNSVIPYFPFSQSLQLGSSENYSNQIIDANSLMLSEGCYLVIDSISRYQSNTPITSLANPAKHEWTISNPPSGLALRDNNLSYSPQLTFTPREVGENADTFSVHVSIHNSTGESKDNCSFLVSYSGESCNQNICPSITKVNDLPADLIDGSNGNLIQKLGFGTKIEMGSGNYIKQTMNGQLGTLCTQFITDNQIATYSVTLPKIDSIIPCSQVTVSVEKLTDGTFDDAQHFTLFNSSATIDEGGSATFSVRFETPDSRTHITSGHSPVYRSKLIVHTSDSYGEICSQQINLEANVSSKAYKVSKSTNMKAFSQVSGKETKPSYAAYSIAQYNPIYNYYGQQDKLDPDRGSVNLLTTPPTPNTDHSFYFEVDHPTIDSIQNPKLYLVNNDLNKYSMISAQPIARYSNNSIFSSDLENLMQDVFKGSFQSRGNAPHTTFTFSTLADKVIWSPSLSSAQLAGPGKGLEIKMGEVYIIWNPEGNRDIFSSGGKTYSDYCDVAFLFIEEVSDGDGSSHNIGNVTFYVVYPLTTIMQ